MADGLRERKKQRTRHLLAEEAMKLFLARGFDAVTVAEIAAEADVAVGTVFNYFESKEELFFDRADELLSALTDAVGARPAGTSVAAAFRAWHEGELEVILNPEAAGITRRFFQTIENSQALQNYELVLRQRLEDGLVAAVGGNQDRPTPSLLAAQLTALHGSVVNACRRAILQGDPPDVVRSRARVFSNQAFALLSDTAMNWGTHEPGALPSADP